MHLPKSGIVGDSTAPADTVQELDKSAVRVAIGEWRLAKPPEQIFATLGSCIGVCIVWPRKQLYVLAHVLLPDVRRAFEPKGDDCARYGSTVVPHLLSKLKVPPSKMRELRAYLAGGANMLGADNNKAMVGAENIEVTRRSLRENHVRLIAEDTGGETGRHIVVDGVRSRVYTQTLGGSSRVTIWKISNAKARMEQNERIVPN